MACPDFPICQRVHSLESHGENQTDQSLKQWRQISVPEGPLITERPKDGEGSPSCDYLVVSKGCRTVEHPETESREDGSVDGK